MVNMYDSAIQRWESQKVSGEPPEFSENLCVVGVLGDNGTYEVRPVSGRLSQTYSC
jgi:hypothetical protein